MSLLSRRCSALGARMVDCSDERFRRRGGVLLLFFYRQWVSSDWALFKRFSKYLICLII